ncbi:hypothetical protein ACGYU6_30105, partial [Burkholderia pseudomallei]
ERDGAKTRARKPGRYVFVATATGKACRRERIGAPRPRDAPIRSRRHANPECRARISIFSRLIQDI